jgi:Ca2+-transporting ATPase
MGAIRMSRAQVLTRRASSIETLGAATILCTDKTGTLTENRMAIAELRLLNGHAFETQAGLMSLDPAFQNLVELGILASAEQPIDPMEIAFHALGTAHPSQRLRSRQQAGWTLQHRYPVRPQLLAMSHVWGNGGSQDHVIASKGAPEAIADLCGLDSHQREDLHKQVNAMAEMGLRILAVAEAHWPSQDTLPATQHHFSFEFRGLVGLTDPVRASVPDAVHQCQQAGIRVVMITGDYPGTALAIASKAGIANDNVVTGDRLADMGAAELAQCVAATSVFARIMPEQKLRIVEAFKAQGEIVAMTGDGVNDAPSLKAAHIGIAMGGRGTDVAREAASLVLLNDDFESIARAIRLGRRIYDNLRKAMGFIVAAHIPIAGFALLPLLAGLPLLLGPIHIAVLEMVIDPVCSLVFEAETEEQDVMQRAPRSSDSSLFSRQLVGWSLLQGSVVMLVVTGLTFYLASNTLSVAAIRSGAFLALVLGIVTLILLNRTFARSSLSAIRRPNTALLAIASGVVIMLAATQTLPAFATLFRFEPVALTTTLIIITSTALMLGGLEMLRLLVRRRLVSS